MVTDGAETDGAVSLKMVYTTLLEGGLQTMRVVPSPTGSSRVALAGGDGRVRFGEFVTTDKGSHVYTESSVYSPPRVEKDDGAGA